MGAESFASLLGGVIYIAISNENVQDSGSIPFIDNLERESEARTTTTRVQGPIDKLENPKAIMWF